MEVSLRSDLTPCHPMCTARLQGLNLLDEEGTERGGSKVATASHRTGPFWQRQEDLDRWKFGNMVVASFHPESSEHGEHMSGSFYLL